MRFRLPGDCGIRAGWKLGLNTTSDPAATDADIRGEEHLGETCRCRRRRRANATSTAIAMATLYLPLMKDSSGGMITCQWNEGRRQRGTTDHLGASV